MYCSGKVIAFDVSYILGAVTLLTVSCVMVRNSIDLVNRFLKEGIQIRHAKNLTPMNAATVDNKHFHATVDKMQEGKIMQSLLVNNEHAYISHYNSVFEELWKNGIDAVERIRDIEAGVDLADIEVVPSSIK